MKVKELLSITENAVCVFAPAYNKVGKKYKEEVLIGVYSRYNKPKDNILDALIIRLEPFDSTDRIRVTIDV